MRSNCPNHQRNEDRMVMIPADPAWLRCKPAPRRRINADGDLVTIVPKCKFTRRNKNHRETA